MLRYDEDISNTAATSANPPNAPSSHQVQEQDKIGYGEEPDVADFTMHQDAGGGMSSSHEANGDHDHISAGGPSPGSHPQEPEPFGANLKEDG